MSIKMEFDPTSVANFASLIREMQKTTGADMDKVLRNTARDFCKRAMFVTPRSPRTERVQKSDGSFFNRKLPFGFAKSGWVLALQKLGLSTGSGFIKGKGLGLKFGDFKDKRKQRIPSIEVANQIPFIEELDSGSAKNPAHHIMFRAMDKTQRDMERRLSRMAERMAKRWVSI